jgi:septum formation protein
MSSIYLASQSPRRRELLAQIGVCYELISVDVPEEYTHGETPSDYVSRLSTAKAMAGSQFIENASMKLQPVLGADTIVVIDENILEKPGSQSEAVDMLLALSGRAHQVMTSVSLCLADQAKTILNTTEVHFRKISPAEAKAYWNTGEPVDKAGGYGIQGLGAVFVEKIQGSYSSVVGLPLLETAQLLSEFHIPVWQKSSD